MTPIRIEMKVVQGPTEISHRAVKNDYRTGDKPVDMSQRLTTVKVAAFCTR